MFAASAMYRHAEKLFLSQTNLAIFVDSDRFFSIFFFNKFISDISF